MKVYYIYEPLRFSSHAYYQLLAILSYFRLAQFGTEINLWDLGWKQWTGIMCTLRELP